MAEVKGQSTEDCQRIDEVHVEMNTALIMHEEAQSEELSLTLYLWSEFMA